MPKYHDNSTTAAPQADSIPNTNERDRTPAIITAELTLLDMLAHLIVDAVQRDTKAPIAKDT